MTKFISLWLIFFSLSTLAQNEGSSFLVGNAAEGILEDGKVYLRDLFEYNAHQNPFIGKETDGLLKEKLKIPAFVNLQQSSLLVRKLTDLNRISPQLGHYLAEVISFYNWVLIDSELLPFPDNGSTMDTYASRVPLANRFMFTVRIQKKYWDLLNNEHKVATLIHEAYSSLLNVDCEKNNCFQSNHKVRELTARSFLDPDPSRRPFSSLLENWLLIPDRSFRMSCPHSGSQILVRFKDGSTKSLKNAADKIARDIFTKDICNQHIHNLLSLEVLRNPYRLLELSYLTHNQDFYRQFYVGFIPVSSIWSVPSKGLPNLNESQCFTLLSSQFNIWFNYAYGTLSPDPLFSCRADLP